MPPESPNDIPLASSSIAKDMPCHSPHSFSWRRVTLTISALLGVLLLLIVYMELSGFSPFKPGQQIDGNLLLAQGSTNRNGPAFDLTNTTIHRNQILGGGPPKDGIPALTNARFLATKEASFMQAADRVIGVIVAGEARAYPLKILNYHEIVNDRVGKVPVAVTYCPLCDSAAVFDRRTPVGEREFGVSGLLYNSNVLMYDRDKKTESLWSQILASGVSGPGAEKELDSLPLELVTWGEWSQKHPMTLVLSHDTGHPRDYTRSPYSGYFQSPALMFPAQPTSDRLPAKERILGVWIGDTYRAYPESAFSEDKTKIEDHFAEERVVIEYNPETKSLRVAEADHGVEWMYSFWFAWYAMHPETEVFNQN